MWRSRSVALVASAFIATSMLAAQTLPAAAAGAHLTYYGGPVVAQPRVVVVLWGTTVNSQVAQGIAGFTQQYLNSTSIDVLSEYNPTGANPQVIGRGSLVGQFTITPSITSTTIDDTAIQAELQAQVASGHLPQPGPTGSFTNTIYSLFFPPGITITLGGTASCQAFIRYHGAIAPTASTGTLLYTVLPDLGPANACANAAGNGTQFQNTTANFSAVLASTITDPMSPLATSYGPPMAWIDSTNGEIGDICNNQQAVFSGTNGVTYTAQKVFSNLAGTCILNRDAPVNDFSLTTVPSFASLPQGGSATVDVATAPTSGAAATIALAVSGAPSGVTATLSSTTLSAGAHATLTLAAATTAVAGTYTVVVTGTEGARTHSASISLTVTAAPTQLTNGGFETGTLLGWTTSTGTAAVISAAGSHSGSYAARLGSTTATNGDSTIQQRFTVPPGYTQLGVWYRSICPDTVTYDWAQIDLIQTGGSSTPMLSHTCTTNAWTLVTAPVQPGAEYTLILTNHDDNYSTDPTYTLFDDVGFTGAPVTVTGISNGGFESGTAFWLATGTTSISTSGAHSGSRAAMLGSTSATNGDSTFSQTFTAPPNDTVLTFWYQVTCPDSVTYDWFTATLNDNTRNTSTTVVPKTCTAAGLWTKASAPITGGDQYTLTLANRDDNYSLDPTHTLVDDVSTSGGGTPVPTPSPTGQAAPKFLSDPAMTITVNTPAALTLNVSGVPAPTITENGALPEGVTVTTGPLGITGLTGSPTPHAAGVYPITFTATNTIGSDTQNFTLTVANPSPTVTGLDPAVLTAGGAATRVRILGSGFAPGARVTVRGIPTVSLWSNPSDLRFDLTDYLRAATTTPVALDIVVTNPQPGGGSATTHLTLVAAGTTSAGSASAAAGGSATASLPPQVAGDSGLSATITNPGGTPETLTIANYAGNPGTSSPLAAGSSYYDVKVAGATPGSSVAAQVYYPSTITGLTETALSLEYWDGFAWQPVLGSGGTTPAKDTTDNLDATVSGGRFSLTFDDTSTPKITDLTGTFLVLAPLALAQSITFPAPADRVYGDGTFAPPATASSGLKVFIQAAGACTSDGILVTLTAAGTCSLTASQGGDSNYMTAASVTRTFIVNPAQLTAAVRPSSAVYGGPLPVFGVDLSGFVAGEGPAVVSGTPVFTTSPAPVLHPGLYSVDASGLTASNYLIAYTTGTLTVSRAPLTVRANDAGRAFGASDPPFTVTYSTFALGDSAASLGGTLVVGSSATATSPVGTYVLTASGVSSADYEITYAAGTLTVSPAGLTVTVKPSNSVYGDALPPFTVGYAGLAGFDSPSALVGSLGFTTPATSVSHPGQYQVTAGGLSSPNYSITFIDGTLTIAPAALVVTVADAARLYGGPDPAFGVTYSEFKLGQGPAALSGTLTFVAPSPSSPVGSYSITAGGLTSTDYAISYVPGHLLISPAPLKITVQPVSKVYGAALPAFSLAYFGFVGSEGPSALAGTPAFATVATTASPVGSYPVQASGLSSSNYALSFVAGNLEVTPAPLAVAVASASRIYHQPNPTFTGTLAGIVNGDLITVTYSTALGNATAAGTYPGAIIATLAGGSLSNYSVTQSPGTLTVTRMPTSLGLGQTSTTAGTFGATVVAALTESLGNAPIPAEPVMLSAGGLTATATTGAAGTAASTFTIAAGQYTAGATFAGDQNYLPATASPATITVSMPTTFVIWGGNKPKLADALSAGQTYQFWGEGWSRQVRAGYFRAEDFGGFACSVAGTTWTTATGRHDDEGRGRTSLCRPPSTLPAFISVIVTTRVSGGDDAVTGDVAAHAVLRLVSCPASPDSGQNDDGEGHHGKAMPKTYRPDRGHPGCGVLVAVTN